MTVNVSNSDLNNQGDNDAPQTPAPKAFQKRQIVKYFFMPNIIPQIRDLSSSGFGYLAFLIALLYQSVRIIPRNHPYTRYENMGRYGLRDIIAVAANHVKLDRKNIDQVIVFFAVLAGIAILALQFITFILFLFTGEAWAAGPPVSTGIFSTPYPETDIGFFMMREIFGLPDMFGTLVGGPSNLHLALQAMFQFYNLAILVVAVLVFIYYVIVVVGETAESGTPFGQRFSHIYAPIRLVVAIGLLVPLNYGFNGAQYITFYAAKLGLGFATTGWTQFNEALLGSNPLGADNATLIASGHPPDIESIVEFMAIATTCREAYALGENKTIEAYVEVPELTPPTLSLSVGTMDTLITMEYNKDIRIVFGAMGQGRTNYIGNIVPYCGSIVVPVNLAMKDTGMAFNPGELQKNYFLQINALWRDTNLAEIGNLYASAWNSLIYNPANLLPTSARKDEVISDAKIRIDNVVLQYYEAARAGTDLAIKQIILERGCFGAGIWYNLIAQINGAYIVAVRNLPKPQKFPMVMEHVLGAKQKSDKSFSGCKTFEPNLAGGQAPTYRLGSQDRYYADTLNAAYQYWTCDKENNSANFFLDAASAIFGLEGLMSIRERHNTGSFVVDSTGAPVLDAAGEKTPIYTEIHPLAKLSALGKGLIESAISSMALAIGLSFGAGLLSASQYFGAAAGAASGMFVSIATIGLSIGFITYYILPFLPFMYFFFAMSNWVKSIFEAMVGAPLWALAHLRIDGDGLPGKMAMSGYLLIFEIFLRPILTIFGLLGGMAVFTSMAAILNDIFDIVVMVGVGADLNEETDSVISMHIVDVFFFTVVYAVILYMMAVASFKMINTVPNNILRWMGQSVESFSDKIPDETQGLTQYAAIGGARIGGQLAGGITQGAQGLGAIPGGLIAAANQKP